LYKFQEDFWPVFFSFSLYIGLKFKQNPAYELKFDKFERKGLELPEKKHRVLKTFCRIRFTLFILNQSFESTGYSSTCSMIVRSRFEIRNRGRFPFTKKFPLGISVWEECVPFATSSIRGSRGTPGRLKERERSGPGDKNNKNENSVNGTQIFHWEVSTGKTGLSFQQFRLFQKIFSETNQKVVFHLHPNRNFRNFLVNGKRPKSSKLTSWDR